MRSWTPAGHTSHQQPLDVTICPVLSMNGLLPCLRACFCSPDSSHFVTTFTGSSIQWHCSSYCSRAVDMYCSDREGRAPPWSLSMAWRLVPVPPRSTPRSYSPPGSPAGRGSPHFKGTSLASIGRFFKFTNLLQKMKLLHSGSHWNFDFVSFFKIKSKSKVHFNPKSSLTYHQSFFLRCCL